MLDPAGEAVCRSLKELGHASAAQVRIGKAIDVWVETRDAEEARRTLDRMASELLSNPVTETYEIELLKDGDAS